jgi:O-antigen ligase
MGTAGTFPLTRGGSHFIAAVTVLLALPWLLAFAPGPSANMVPWLASAACTLAAFALLGGVPPARRWLLVLAAVVLFVALRPAEGPLDRTAFAAGAALALLAFCVARGCAQRDDEAVAAIAQAWLVAALVSCAIALLQYFDQAGFLQPWVYPSKIGEAVANLRQRNQFASLTTIGLAALLWLAARSPGRWWPWAVPVVVLAVGNAATTSRTGLLQWVMVLGLSVAWSGLSRKRNVLLCLTGLVAYAAAVLALPVLLQQVTGADTDSLFTRLETDLGCSSRRVLWANVLQLVAARPLLGWGWGELDYAHYLHLYGDAPRFCDILDNAHNLPLHIAVELGVPAAVLLCVLVAVAVLRARPWYEAAPTRRLAWTVLAVIGLHSLLEYPLWYGPFQLALGLALGLLAKSRVPPLLPQARASVAVLGAAALAFVAWDYDLVSQLYLEPEQRRAWWREDTLAHAQRSVLFAQHARFAELTLAPLTRDNARWNDATAQALLHYSPEPRIIERVIESATLQERYDDAVLHLARYRAAFPLDHARWRQAQQRMPQLPER